VVTPVWSPDGQWIAYLRRDHGVTQLWRARRDGSKAQAVTRSPVDVERFVWSRDGARLIYGATPAVIEAGKAIDREGLSGWYHDARIVPNLGTRPLVSGDLRKTSTWLIPRRGL
jgi:dipeptidyl aminopeptidase/acylaminoacyl peptidase